MVVGMLGLEVVTASDGEEALALAGDEWLCLILLDLTVPGIDGFSIREARLRHVMRVRQRAPQLFRATGSPLETGSGAIYWWCLTCFSEPLRAMSALSLS
jgi:CheY-like chemotaxis protein